MSSFRLCYCGLILRLDAHLHLLVASCCYHENNITNPVRALNPLWAQECWESLLKSPAEDLGFSLVHIGSHAHATPNHVT